MRLFSFLRGDKNKSFESECTRMRAEKLTLPKEIDPEVIKGAQRLEERSSSLQVNDGVNQTTPPSHSAPPPKPEVHIHDGSS